MKNGTIKKPKFQAEDFSGIITGHIDAKTAIFEKKPISCKELLHASLQNFAIPLELKEIQVKEEIEDQASYIGDFSWSLEAISNLIKNCMEHTLAGGCLFLKASENAIYTEIIIEDNGEGFLKEDIPSSDSGYG